MIKSRAELKEYLEEESKGTGSGVMARIPVDLFEQQVIHKFLRLLRITEYHMNTGHKVRKWYYYFRLKRKQLRYGLFIQPNCFGKGLSIAHTGGVLINGDCRVGTSCRIHSGVKIVAGAEGVPDIGNHVYLGVNACVLGKVKIADGCTVGAGAIVCKSCEQKGAVLAGVPAEVKKKKNRAWDGEEYEN